MKKLILFFVVIVKLCHWTSAQNPEFRNPLGIPIQLSANFGEIRTDHFHTGYDIRTKEKTGYNVYASADGYVSRIKVSPYGYGKVLYITHPNGYMTVYGHLDKFNDTIAQYVKQQQYAKQSFEIELFPDSKKFPVKQGDIIALSGNSGGSTGPHLHFEIRDASGESYPLNPKEFLPLEDSMPPRFKAVYLYPLTGCCKTQSRVKYNMIKINSFYTSNPDSIRVKHRIVGLGVDAADFSQTSPGSQGIYQLEEFVDDKLIFSMKLDRLDFSNGLYANAHIDYEEWRKTGTAIQKTFVKPGDKNSIYHEVKNSGEIIFSDTLYHKISIKATDENNNSSLLNLMMKFSENEEHQDSAIACAAEFTFDKASAFNDDSFKLNVNAHSLYDDFCFQYKKDSLSANFYSAVFHVGDPFTPLHKNCDLYILPRAIPQKLRSKAVIVYRNANSGLSGKTTRWEGDWLTTKTRNFGDYFVRLDTLAPVIRPLGIKQNKLITKNDLEFSASDNLSGITSYKAMLDGKWYLMEYEPKNDKMIVELDETVSKGNHVLEIIASDEVSNQTRYQFSFIK